jgi:non-specific serine/threonine protein kinase
VYAPPPSVLEHSPDIPARFDGVVQRAIAKDPTERYASAGELGLAARSAVDEKTPAQEEAPAAPAPRAEPPVTQRGRGPSRRLLAGVVALVLAVGAVLAVVLLPGSDSPDADRASPAPAAPLQLGSKWRRLPSMPTPRQNMTGTVLDGTIWVVGGVGVGSSGSRRIEGYDPVINGWKAGPDLPLRLHHEMAVTYKGELVVIGGWIPEGSNPSAETSDRVFALRGGKWVRLPSLDRPRAAGAAAVVGDRIVVVGGQAGGRLLATSEVFDGEQWSTKAPIPTPREHLAAASDGQFVYAVGGRALSPDKNSAALERYDPATDSWQPLPDMPTARGGLGAAIANGHLFAVGGESSTDALGEVESYNLATQDWSKAPTMRTPRHGIVVVALDRSLYALGGAPRPGHASARATAEALRLRR